MSLFLWNVAALAASADVLQRKLELKLGGQLTCFPESCWTPECSLNKVLTTYFHSHQQQKDGGWGGGRNRFKWFHLDQNGGVGLPTVCARVLVWLTSIPYHTVQIYNLDFVG